MEATTATAPRAALEGEATFRQGLSLLDATMLVAGSMIGSGIFIVSADIARTMGSAGWLLVVWLVTGVLTLFAALSYGELAAAMPKAGGQYVFLREGLGPLPGFLYGWTLFLVIQTGTIAAVAVAFARFLAVFVPALSPDVFLSFGHLPMPGGTIEVGLSAQRLVAIAVIGLLTWVNMRGLREGKWVQNVFTIAKTGAVLGLIVLGLTVGWNARALAANFSHPFAGAPTGGALVLAFGAAMVGSLFAADAWNNVTFAAAEVRSPGRNLPLALALGTGLVTLLYLLANVTYLVTLTLPEIQTAAQDRVATVSAQAIFGPAALYLMAGAILVSTFGCINGMILAGARVYYAMARDGLFFRAAGHLSPRTHVPTWALALQGVWTAFLTLTGTYSQLLDYVIFAALLFYVLTIAALFALRVRRPELPRPYRAFGYPLVPALYLVAAAAIALILLVAKPVYTFSGLFLVVLGIPVFFIWRRGARADALAEGRDPVATNEAAAPPSGG
ncbi:MAG: amino acid permease [Microbispora sp.]|nr:amino acid permease [Microbispora sp.]